MSPHPAVAAKDAPQEFPMSEAEFRYLAQLLHETTGILLNSSKMNMVYARLVRRLRELKLTSFAMYCDLLKGDRGQAEMATLINALTTNLTRFFREPHHFAHLRSKLLPGVAARRGKAPRRLRIWSAGCSSGEEPYSIATVLADEIGSEIGWDARILATDLDTSMLATARAGLYPGAAFDDLPSAIRDRYFKPVENSRRSAVHAIRKYITFKQLNLIEPWPVKGPFDAIFCRNVMIYFDGPTKTMLVDRFCDLLAPGGCLYIGHSETLIDNKTRLALDGRTVYRKAAA